MNYAGIYFKLIDHAKLSPPSGRAEIHHIKPRSLGGDNNQSNLIALTPRQHFVAHRLLAKIHGGSMWAALAFMARGNTNSARDISISSRVYETIKINDAEWRSERYTAEGNPFFGMSHNAAALLKMRRPRINKAGLYGRSVDGVGDVISFVRTYRPRYVEPDLSLMHRIEFVVASSDANTSKMVSFYRRVESMQIAVAGRDYRGCKNPNYGNGKAVSGENNPMFGVKHKEHTKKLIGDKARRTLRCPHCGKESNIANAHRWHFDNCKRKDS